jgi:hypothetical protein
MREAPARQRVAQPADHIRVAVKIRKRHENQPSAFSIQHSAKFYD